MLRQELIENLKDEEYRCQFVSAQVRRTVAAQIRALRGMPSREWTQAKLGQLAGMKPNAICRLENPDYGDFSVKTLLRLANAFDVGLIIRYAALSELVEWNQSVSTASYTPPSFGEDRRLFPLPNPVHISKNVQESYYRGKGISPGRTLNRTVVGNIEYQNITPIYDEKDEITQWQKENKLWIPPGSEQLPIRQNW